MPVTTLSSRELHQDAGKAKRAAKNGPVIITDRGRPSFVLLNIDEYHSLVTEPCPRIADRIGSPEAAEIDFDPPRLDLSPRYVNFD